MFRQPAFKKNALHEYLNNEDAAANTNTAAVSGAYAPAEEEAERDGYGLGEKVEGDKEQQVEDGEMKVVGVLELSFFR